MINIIFTFVKGEWKFHAALRDQETLDKELRHLDREGFKTKVSKLEKFDLEKIEQIENDLNK